MTTLAAAAAASPSFTFRPIEEKDDYNHHQQQQPRQHQLHPQQQAAQLYQSHLTALELQSQRHTHQQQQQSNPNLSPRQMLAAQQHFGFAIQQAQQQREAPPAPGTTPSGGWNDDSELFLRNLLASNVNSPPSSISGGGSYMATPSPSYVNGTSSADEHLSPGSSSGFQSLHDFIHNNGVPTPPNSDTSAYIAMSGSEHMGTKSPPSMIMHPQQQQQQMMFSGQDQHPQMDSNALEFFVNSMIHGNDRSSMAGQGGLDPSLVSTMGYDYMGDTSLGYQQSSFAQQSMPPQQYQQMMQQQQQQSQGYTFQQPQQHPALEGRKRSAPSALGSEAVKAPATAKQPRASKKVRRQSSFGQQVMPTVPVSAPAPLPAAESVPAVYQPMASFMPRMEVGSNATALAAIERLKAKRRAEMEQRIKQEEAMASLPKKEGGKGSGRTSEGSTSSGEPMQKNQKKVAHNAIERRYRNNINDRITALRNAVPALRELRPKKSGGSRKGKGAQEQDLVDGVPAATKLNKATILGKATEYIRYLKGRETRLVSEVAGLRELIRSLEGGEELLDLWEGEMEKVVAEQEAKAKEAFALEDDSFDFGGSDEEEDEEDDFDVKPSSRSSSGSSSSRYMMGVFMGFSVLGGGAELLSEHHAASTASESARTVVQASSGRVFGASHQLLKRGMAATNVKVGSVADLPHHFDHVPSHVLAVEVMRGLALLACLAFIFWPLIGRFVMGAPKKTSKASPSSPRNAFERKTELLRRKQMLDALSRSRPRPHEMDMSMRKFLGAPGNAVNSGLALAKFFGTDLACRIGLSKRAVMDTERAAVWCRLLELETSLGPLAHRSLLARLHTILTIATLPNLGSNDQSEDATVLNSARVYGTMAIAIVRAARRNSLALMFAERIWTNARRCRLSNIEQEEEDASRDVQDRWIDSTLEHSLSDAIALCPSPTAVAGTFSKQVDSNTRASLLSPLLSIAAIQQGHQLTQVWSSLLRQIVQSTCPPSQKDAVPTVSDFMKHHSDVKIFLSSVATQSDQDRMSDQISRLALSAPKCESWQTISNVTFGTWALLIGNISVARSVAAALLSSATGADLPICATAFIKLVFDGNDDILAIVPNGAVEAINEVDALAAASLNWLQFLRLIAASAKGHSKNSELVAEKALHIRRLLAGARMARSTIEEALLLTASMSQTDLAAAATPSTHRDSLSSTFSSTTSSSPSTPSEDPQGQLQGQQGAQLDDTLDTLTDILALLGSKAALGTLHDWKRYDEEAEKHDSGVEWGI